MEQVKKDIKRALKEYKKADGGHWTFAFFSSRIVGTYGKGATLELADEGGISSDTVEDHAHAYWLYAKLRNLGSEERSWVQKVRKLPFLHYSHFRALYDLQISHHLTDQQIMNLLLDIVQAEGKISSRGLEDHARSRYGDTRTWDYYGAKALKELSKVQSQPDLPNTQEVIGNLYAVVLEMSGVSRQYFVVAYNPQRAEKVARKAMVKTMDEENDEKISLKAVNEIDVALTDSKHILNVTSSWLGENA